MDARLVQAAIEVHVGMKIPVHWLSKHGLPGLQCVVVRRREDVEFAWLPRDVSDCEVLVLRCYPEGYAETYSCRNDMHMCKAW